MAKIKVSAFRWVPPAVQGLVRDLRVRWALEEVGLAYEERLLGRGDGDTEEYRRLQPFGQVPVYEEDGLEMFESGAIVLHIAEKTEALLPKEPVARARAQTWMFAALNTIEPRVLNLVEIDLFFPQEEWARLRRPMVLEALQGKLRDLSHYLDDKEYLEGHFTAGDLLMTTVLRATRHVKILDEFPALEAYRLRCEARPAFQRALAAQMVHFQEGAQK